MERAKFHEGVEVYIDAYFGKGIELEKTFQAFGRDLRQYGLKLVKDEKSSLCLIKKKKGFVPTDVTMVNQLPGVIFDCETSKVLNFPMCAMLPINDKKERLEEIAKDTELIPIYEGFYVYMFSYEGKWRISTPDYIDAADDILFGVSKRKRFRNSVTEDYLLQLLNTDNCYTFNVHDNTLLNLTWRTTSVVTCVMSMNIVSLEIIFMPEISADALKTNAKKHINALSKQLSDVSIREGEGIGVFYINPRTNIYRTSFNIFYRELMQGLEKPLYLYTPAELTKKFYIVDKFLLPRYMEFIPDIEKYLMVCESAVSKVCTSVLSAVARPTEGISNGDEITRAYVKEIRNATKTTAFRQMKVDKKSVCKYIMANRWRLSMLLNGEPSLR